MGEDSKKKTNERESERESGRESGRESNREAVRKRAAEAAERKAAARRKEVKKKKIILFSSLIGILLIAGIVCVILFMNKEKTPAGGGGTASSTSADTASSGSGAATEAQKTEATAAVTEAPSTEVVTEAPKPKKSQVNQLMLEIVCSNLYGMRNYSWQKANDPALSTDNTPVALSDFNQDDVMDILFMTAGDGTGVAEVYIFGYKDANANLLFHEAEFDVQAGGGVSYCFFKDAKNVLYLYYSTGDEYRDQTWYRFDPQEDGTLAKTVMAHHRKSSEGDTYDGEGVTDEATYNSVVEGLVKNLEQLVLFNNIDDEQLHEAAAHANDISYTADDVIRYLEGGANN